MIEMQPKPEELRSSPFANTFLVAVATLASLAIAGCGQSSSGGSSQAAVGSPAKPSNLQALTAYNTVHLTWTDNSDDETYFRIDIQRDNGSWKEHGTVAADVTEFGSTGLKLETQYKYRVRAANANGLSKPSNEVVVNTPIAPTSACGLVIAEELSGPAQASAQSGHRYWVWAVHSGSEDVVARAAAAGAEEVELDGGQDGTTWIATRRRELGRRVELEMKMRFSTLDPLYDGFEGPLCLMLHDLARGGFAQGGIPASSRQPFRAQMPLPGPLPIFPGQSYFVTIGIDRIAGEYDAHLNGIRIAAGVPLDGVLVIPAVYVHP